MAYAVYGSLSVSGWGNDSRTAIGGTGTATSYRIDKDIGTKTNYAFTFASISATVGGEIR